MITQDQRNWWTFSRVEEQRQTSEVGYRIEKKKTWSWYSEDDNIQRLVRSTLEQGKTSVVDGRIE